MPDVPANLASALADRYTIERELGQGGMATVYLAQDLKHDRKVALKVLKPELAAVIGAERFVVEIKTTASLQHPHILPLFDSGTAGGFLYYVMPFIDGETLRTKLDRETQLGVDEAVKIATDIADALDYAHQHGVIHRDIKPENILLQQGRPMVADFGIALALSAAAGGRMTETGLSLGTPHYMSPEQATAEKEITARSDVYSLGTVLYEMLAGQPPHLGGSAQQIIMKIVTEEAAPVTRMRKAVPPNVAAAVARSLEKLPADRFASAAAFAGALRNPNFSTVAMPAAARAAGARGRWPMLAGGLLLGALAGAAAVRWGMPPAAASGAERGREQLTFDGQSQTPGISPDGKQLAYIRVTCAGSQCRAALMVQEVGSTKASALLTNALDLGAPRWSHDGGTIVVAGALDASRQGLFAVPRLSGTPRLIGPSGAYDTHPAADSVLVVPSRPQGPGVALVLDLESGAARDSFPVPFSSALDINWAPDGRHIAALTNDGLTVIDRTGRVTGSASAASRATVRWSVDGRAVLYFQVGTVREDRLVRVPIDAEGRIGGAPEVLLPRVATLYDGEFDIARRTGQVVLKTGDAITDLWVFDLSKRPVRDRQVTRGTTWYGTPVLSHEGTSLYYYRGDALGDNVYLLDLTTGNEEALTAQRLPGGNAMRLSADGRRLAYAHSTGGVPRLEYIELPSRRIHGDTASILNTNIEPVGSAGFLALRRSDGSLAQLDSLGGTLRTIPIPPSLRVAAFAAAPDGRRVGFIARVTEPPGPGSAGGLTGLKRGDQVIGEASLVDSVVRIIGKLPENERTAGLTWDLDGALHLGRWLPSEEYPSIWRVGVMDGALTRLADLPAHCEASEIRVAARGRAASCTVSDFRADIWRLDIAGVAR